MTSKRARTLSPILPIMAIVVSIGTVTWEYARRDRLVAELRTARREYKRLEAQQPAGERETSSRHDDDEH